LLIGTGSNVASEIVALEPDVFRWDVVASRGGMPLLGPEAIRAASEGGRNSHLRDGYVSFARYSF
jgi:hypothetical protein